MTRSVLYPTVWRWPLWLLGVPRTYWMALLFAGIGLGLLIFYFIWEAPAALLVGVVILGVVGWPIGLVLGRRDPDFMRVLQARMQLALKARDLGYRTPETGARVWYK